MPSQPTQISTLMEKRIIRVMAYIDHHLDNPISLDDISKLVLS